MKSVTSTNTNKKLTADVTFPPKQFKENSLTNLSIFFCHIIDTITNLLICLPQANKWGLKNNFKPKLNVLWSLNATSKYLMSIVQPWTANLILIFHSLDCKYCHNYKSRSIMYNKNVKNSIPTVWHNSVFRIGTQILYIQFT